MRHLAPIAAALLGCLALVPAASAQTGSPTIQSVQPGCFYRLGRANNVLVKLAAPLPLTASYRFTFLAAGTQQAVLDQVLATVHAGEELPFQVPAAGTYRLAVRFALQGPGAPATTSAPFTVSAVMVATVNGQPACQIRATATNPGQTRE